MASNSDAIFGSTQIDLGILINAPIQIVSNAVFTASQLEI